MIEVYVVDTYETTWRKKFEFFKIKNKGKTDVSKFSKHFLRSCFRDRPLMFLKKYLYCLFQHIYFTQIFHRGTLWLKKLKSITRCYAYIAHCT